MRLYCYEMLSQSGAIFLNFTSYFWCVWGCIVEIPYTFIEFCDICVNVFSRTKKHLPFLSAASLSLVTFCYFRVYFSFESYSGSYIALVSRQLPIAARKYYSVSFIRIIYAIFSDCVYFETFMFALHIK